MNVYVYGKKCLYSMPPPKKRGLYLKNTKRDGKYWLGNVRMKQTVNREQLEVFVNNNNNNNNNMIMIIDYV
jgi:hypothetical protein